MTALEPLYCIKIPAHEKWPRFYDNCPSCGKIKTTHAKLCHECRVGPRTPKDICNWCGPSCLFGVGICHCGCGEETDKSQGTNKKIGSIKGRHNKFIRNHHARKTRQQDEMVVIDGDQCVRVSLTQGMFAIIDAGEYPKVQTIKRWVAVKTPTNCYVRSNKNEGDVLLHRFIMDAKEHEIVDHKNGDGLDNRKKNLRFCTQSENMRNRSAMGASRFKGVCWNKSKGKWIATLCLGSFETAEEAAEVYDRAMMYIFSEFGRPNFKEDIKCV